MRRLSTGRAAKSTTGFFLPFLVGDSYTVNLAIGSMGLVYLPIHEWLIFRVNERRSCTMQ